jgi:hypothetical protein
MPNSRAGDELALARLRTRAAYIRQIDAAQHFLAVAEQAALVGLARVEESVAGEMQHVERARAECRQDARPGRIAPGEHIERHGLATEQLLQRLALSRRARQVARRIDDQQHAQRVRRSVIVAPPCDGEGVARIAATEAAAQRGM